MQPLKRSGPKEAGKHEKIEQAIKVAGPNKEEHTGQQSMLLKWRAQRWRDTQ